MFLVEKRSRHDLFFFIVTMPVLMNLMIRSNCPEFYKEFLDSYLFNLRKCLFQIFPDSYFF